MEIFLIAIIALYVYIPKDCNIPCICNNYGNIVHYCKWVGFYFCILNFRSQILLYGQILALKI